MSSLSEQLLAVDFSDAAYSPSTDDLDCGHGALHAGDTAEGDLLLSAEDDGPVTGIIVMDARRRLEHDGGIYVHVDGERLRLTSAERRLQHVLAATST